MNCLTPDKKLTPGCFETILDTMAEAVCVVDKDCIIRYCNKAMSQMTGLPSEKIIDRPCNDMMVCSCKSPNECPVFKSGSINNIECELLRKDKAPMPVLKSGGVIKDDGGNISGAVETLTDISALKRNEIRLAELEASIRHRSGIGGIVGTSHPMQQVFELVEMAAASQATVLITGETGTGKELVAQAIHDLSNRNDGPLIKVNCSALPENLLESELFGHARGAFTGAIQDKIGRFELANGGTIFLDEIGDVSPLIQVKLLRFLQEKEFERVGENSTRRSDVRIIAATNRNLLEMISKGDFRDDLYYRLKVFPIHLPPLRARKEDIRLLTDHFIAKFNKETSKEITGVNHDAALTMMDYCWPGNIRELENAIEHAFVTCKRGKIGVFDLPIEIRKVELRNNICLTDNSSSIANEDSSVKIINPKEISANDLQQLLSHYQGNKTRVAEHIGVDRTTVWRMMKRMGL